MLDFEEMKENQRDVQFGFIVNELDLAITFCDTALAADEPEKAQRNKKHATDAYNAAIHFAKKTRLTPKMVSEVNERIQRLKSLLEQLKATEH